MHNQDTVVVAVAEFTIAPGARYRKDGDGSAEEFFENYFQPTLAKRENAEKKICIDFDGTYGYASSFISELAKDIKVNYGNDFIRSRLLLKSFDDLMLEERFKTELEKDYENS